MSAFLALETQLPLHPLQNPHLPFHGISHVVAVVQNRTSRTVAFALRRNRRGGSACHQTRRAASFPRTSVAVLGSMPLLGFDSRNEHRRRERSRTVTVGKVFYRLLKFTFEISMIFVHTIDNILQDSDSCQRRDAC